MPQRQHKNDLTKGSKSTFIYINCKIMRNQAKQFSKHFVLKNLKTKEAKSVLHMLICWPSANQSHFQIISPGNFLPAPHKPLSIMESLNKYSLTPRSLSLNKLTEDVYSPILSRFVCPALCFQGHTIKEVNSALDWRNCCTPGSQYNLFSYKRYNHFIAFNIQTKRESTYLFFPQVC